MRETIVAKFKQQIEDARRGIKPTASPSAVHRELDFQEKIRQARAALASWGNADQRRLPRNDGGIFPDSSTLNRVELLTRAWNEPEGYRAIEGYDETLAAILTIHGCRAASSDAAVAAMRQEAALTFLYAAQDAERGRQMQALERAIGEVGNRPVETVVVVGAKAEEPLPSPSIRMSDLFKDWLNFTSPPPKARQRMEHQFKRIIEFMGDKPANHVSKRDIIEYMGWVSRFPVLKGAERLLPIRQFVLYGESVKAKSLTKESVTEWFHLTPALSLGPI